MDGDAGEESDEQNAIFKLPGSQPELTIFDSVVARSESNLALMTVVLHQAPTEQERVKQVFEKVSRANREPHQLFNQIGLELGFVPEQTVQGAFITQWLRENGEQVSKLIEEIRKAVTNSAGVNAT